MTKVKGSALRVGDTLSVWWAGGRDTITAIRPYHGTSASLFPEGAQIASFAINQGGMTVLNGDLYEVVASMTEAGVAGQ